MVPAIIMSDLDKAQMNVVNTVYLDSRLLLCWWHVLRAIQMHFCMEEFPEVWNCIREWVKTMDQLRFDTIWEWIQTKPSVPRSLIIILRLTGCQLFPFGQVQRERKGRSFKRGIPICLSKHKSSYRCKDHLNRSLSLLSSYHHVLKSHWLDGKKNRHADHLVSALVVDMLPAYERCCHCQEHKFDGADLAKKQCKTICAHAPEMSAESIQSLGREHFCIRSASDLEKSISSI